jgi:hypothetical protein
VLVSADVFDPTGAAMTEDDPERLAKRACEFALAALEKMEEAGFTFEEDEGEGWRKP